MTSPVPAGVVPPTTGPARPPAPALRFDGASRIFQDGAGVHDVSFEVPAAEFVVLVGPSGAGKSTLLRLVNGLQTPDRGQVTALGTDPAACSARQLRRLRTRIGFIFQQFGLVSRTTALENVLAGGLGRLRAPRYGLLTFPLSMRTEALAQLDRVGLADRAFQRCDTLSGGQQQRVAIARTLFQKPELVLADEPVASLDPESSDQVMEVLVKVCKEDGLTVVCSLHQVELALTWGGRIVGLRDGHVVLVSPVGQLTRSDVMSVYTRTPPGAPGGVA